jgi:hypothetical protein
LRLAQNGHGFLVDMALSFLRRSFINSPVPSLFVLASYLGSTAFLLCFRSKIYACNSLKTMLPGWRIGAEEGFTFWNSEYSVAL